uniref:CNNM transmembrane domain-containing protein n=1 Tax=Syphacia muris TaxID=451379 RepID=A0A0N5AUQ3_9BILA
MKYKNLARIFGIFLLIQRCFGQLQLNASKVISNRNRSHFNSGETEIFGIRVVDIGKVKGFVAYALVIFDILLECETGITVVHPEVEVRVNVFGYNLDQISLLTLTTENCFTPAITVNIQDFVVHRKDRIDFDVKFEESEEAYQLCYDMVTNSDGKTVRDMIMIDDIRTWITTEPISEKEHILPLYVQITILLILFCLSALMSGLNLGLIALTPQELQLIIQSGSNEEKQYAKAILPVRMKGNYLLCTILIMNVVVNAAIAIFLEDISDGMLAFIISSTGIVVVGEIIPQSICIKKGLAVGAHTIWLTKTFMFITYPLSYPISLILDVLIGENMPVYDRNKLIELMKMAANEEDHELHNDLKIAVGGMEIYQKTVSEILTKFEDVFMLSEDTILNAANITEIIRHGYTRIPVYRNGERNNVVSLLMVKDLALINPNDEFTVKSVCDYYRYPLRFVDENQTLHSLLEEFKEGNYHLAIVERHKKNNTDSVGDNKEPQQRELIGIVTLEDIIEEILQAEIIDETDTIIDNVHRSKRIGRKEPDIAGMFSTETIYKDLSLQMEAQIVHYLKQQSVLFCEKYVDSRALSMILKKNVRELDLTRTAFVDGICAKVTGVNLISRGKMTQRFIVIVEGRAVVEIHNMKFEVGPWNCFGVELLHQLETVIKAHNAKELIRPSSALINSIKFLPDFSLKVIGFCRFIQVLPTSYINAYQVTKIARQTRNGQYSETSSTLLRLSKDSARFRGFSDTQVPNLKKTDVESRKQKPSVRVKRSESSYDGK